MLTKTRPVISHLKCCPICQQEDKEKYGYWYYHRAHQMPEVTTCYKHGCKLKKFIGNKGNEFSVVGFEMFRFTGNIPEWNSRFVTVSIIGENYCIGNYLRRKGADSNDGTGE